jgi:hypothetical protein
MPPINHAVMASAGVIAVSVAVAAAIAVYESPELRRMAEDLRRRIAIALHSLGDGVDPTTQASQEPLFNRPEDAEGFLRSRGMAGDDLGIDADDETRRRQREELMYWNAIRESKKEMERKESEEKIRSGQGSTFDDFLQVASNAEKGTYVYNTGADVQGEEGEGLLRRRGVGGVRSLSSAIYANPFADEHGVDDFDDEQAASLHPLSPGRDEIMSDIYNATEPDRNAASHTLSAQPPQPAPQILFDFDAVDGGMTAEQEREERAYDHTTVGQEDREEAYASIQAWAQNSSNTGFYSPLPVSPPVPLSEPEIISEGMLTPTESGSTVGSGEDIADDSVSQTAHVSYDVLSDDESAGMATPVSWTEVGSVVSSMDEADRS